MQDISDGNTFCKKSEVEAGSCGSEISYVYDATFILFTISK